MNPENTPHEQDENIRIFLQEELNDIGSSLEKLNARLEEQKGRSIKAWLRRSRGRINKEDLDALNDELNSKTARLSQLPDDDVRLFLLRKEIGSLKEEVASVGVRRSWQLSIWAWVVIITLPLCLYFAGLVLIQNRNQGLINTYATQTASAMPTPIPSPTGTGVPIFTPLP